MPPTGPHARTPIWIATLGIGLLGSDLATVFLLDEVVFGVKATDWLLYPILAAGCMALQLWLRKIHYRGSISRDALFGLGIFSATTFISLHALDTAYALYQNTSQVEESSENDRRRRDSRLWMGEIMPRWYEPTMQNFKLYKAGLKIEVMAYGEFYDASMLESPTLMDSVLELRALNFQIDEHGFRETTPLSEARFFALGDSFVFGYGLAQDSIWTEQIQKITGVPSYNLGVSATSPKNQLLLLEHLFRTQGDSLSIDHLVWMIFEGNDLENDYEEWSRTARSGTAMLDGTFVQSLREALRVRKRASIIQKFISGEIVAKSFTSDDNANPYVVDGIKIHFPLYHSKQHGHRLFNPYDTNRATFPRSYVFEHANWPRLVETFHRMRTLSQKHDFPVTVVLVPSAARIYGRYFEGFPKLSDAPHFLNEVAQLASDTGFGVFDLVGPLQRRAETELLYFRDDHHWNLQGNRLVAEILAKHLYPAEAEMNPPKMQ